MCFAVKSEDSFEVGQFRRAKQEGRKACACALLAIFVTVACVTSLLLFFYVWWFGIERKFFCLFCPAEFIKTAFSWLELYFFQTKIKVTFILYVAGTLFHQSISAKPQMAIDNNTLLGCTKLAGYLAHTVFEMWHKST